MPTKTRHPRPMLATDFFSRTFVINLPERTDRRAEVTIELERAGLPLAPDRVEFFPAVRPADAGPFPSIGARGCFASHLGVWRHAHAAGAEHVLVIEDDLHISPRFATERDHLVEALEQTPWDLAYLGHIEPVAEDGPLTLRPWKAPLVTAHFYLVHGRVLGRLITAVESMLERPAGHPLGGPMHVDGALSTFRAQNPDVMTLIAEPNLGWQRSSRSDITPRWFDRAPGLAPLLAAARRVKRWCARE